MSKTANAQNTALIRGFVTSRVWGGKCVRIGRPNEDGLYSYFITLKSENLLSPTNYVMHKKKGLSTTRSIELIVTGTDKAIAKIMTYSAVSVKGRLVLKGPNEGYKKTGCYIECEADDVKPIKAKEL